MPEKISILKESGETLNSNVVSVFMIPDTEKKYIITTENAVDPHGLTVLHVSEMVNGTLQRVATDEEWSSIKTIMRAIISGNVGSYQYLPSVENISAVSQYSRDISVSASASKQMIDNYAAGDKSSAPIGGDVSVPDANTMNNGVVGDVPQVSAEQVPPASSIFPTNNVPVNNEDELIPGIAEVSPSVPSVEVPPVNNINTMPVAPVDAQVTGVNPVVDPNMPLPPTVGVNAMPINGVDGVGVINPVDVSITQQIPVDQVVQVGAVDQVQVQPSALNGNVLETPVSEPQNGGVQIVGPTQIVPTAQIVQEAQPNDLKFDTNVNPSFNPNATLDEVVMGAQQMFMEGVKNLVQTIQEKVYRDLYNKEAELKAREAAVEQKEQMVNSQMMLMMNNFSTASMNPQMAMPPQQQPIQPMQSFQPMQMNVPPVSTVQTTTPVQSVIPPVVTGPTVVSASNDVI